MTQIANEKTAEMTDAAIAGEEIAASAVYGSAGDAPISYEVVSPALPNPRLGYRFLKRAADILLSLIACAVLLLPALFLMFLIMLKDPGSPFYMQKRIGGRGRMIGVLKLRTMKKNADNLEEFLTPEQLEEYRKEYKLRDDPRLIGWKKAGDGKKCFGGMLRQLSLDEIMQIPYNILLKGDMSFVGPRPILEKELHDYYTPEEQEMLLSVKPGLTGYWQAYARNEAKYENGERQRMELYYVHNRSLWMDVKIMFATVGSVIRKSGI